MSCLTVNHAQKTPNSALKDGRGHMRISKEIPIANPNLAAKGAIMHASAIHPLGPILLQALKSNGR